MLKDSKGIAECQLQSSFGKKTNYLKKRLITGEDMDTLTSFLTNIDYEVIFQLTFVTLIMISGPVVIFLLAAGGGDL